MKTFTWLSIFIITVSMVMTFAVFIQQADAHYNTCTVTDVREFCWLIGYPNRTLCKISHYIEFVYTFSFDDHTWERNEDGVVVLVHKPGHENHDQEDRGPFRETRNKIVFNDCGECN